MPTLARRTRNARLFGEKLYSGAREESRVRRISVLDPRAEAFHISNRLRRGSGDSDIFISVVVSER